MGRTPTHITPGQTPVTSGDVPPYNRPNTEMLIIGDGPPKAFFCFLRFWFRILFFGVDFYNDKINPKTSNISTQNIKKIDAKTSKISTQKQQEDRSKNIKNIDAKTSKISSQKHQKYRRKNIKKSSKKHKAFHNVNLFWGSKWNLRT